MYNNNYFEAEKSLIKKLSSSKKFSFGKILAAVELSAITSIK